MIAFVHSTSITYYCLGKNWFYTVYVRDMIKGVSFILWILFLRQGFTRDSDVVSVL